MGWISRLFTGSELDQARSAAEAARERTNAEARDFERWLAASGARDEATKAAAHAHLRNAAAAAEKGDLPGWLEAREQAELARAAYGRGRAALALAHPKEVAALLLADAGEAAAGIRDPEDRSARAAALAELQAWSGDLQSARRTLETITEPIDRASAERALAIARATRETVDPARLARELAELDSDAWNHDEILAAVVEEKCRLGDLAGARAMIAPIGDPDLEARSWRILAEAEGQAGRLAEARAIVAGIDDPAVSAGAWSDFALAQAGHGDVEGALQTAEGIQDERARATALGAIAAALVHAGNDERAEGLLAGITDPEARDDALAWVVSARTAKGDFTGALSSIEDLQSSSTQAQELVALAEAAHAAGQEELASTCLQRAFAAFETLRTTHSYPPAWLARFLVDGRARIGDFDAAEAAIQAIGEERERAEMLSTLAFQVARQPGGGLLRLEGLLERHPGILEQIAIQQAAAQGLFTLTLGRTTRKPAPARGPAPEST